MGNINPCTTGNGKMVCNVFKIQIKCCIKYSSKVVDGKVMSYCQKTNHATLGVKVRNMKMDFNTGGTWR